MAEERVFFPSRGFKIEALMDNIPGERAMVITHPHPLYGGDMNNNVVSSVVEAYRAEGTATLRFNFRGVGHSDGSYREGIGEQEDVAAAIAFMGKAGKVDIDLVGYSFGAWVNAMGIKEYSRVTRMIMVSPPVDFLDFSSLLKLKKLCLVIAGSEDEIAPPERIRRLLMMWNPEARLEIIQGADHFYGGKTKEIESIIRGYLKTRQLAQN